MTERIWTAGLLVIGDEILSGRTQDRNVAQVATWLNLQGIRLAEVRIVADDMAAIGEAVNALGARNDYLFTTGGIGPTHDDITVDAIAAALGVPVVGPPEGAGDPGGLLCDPRRRHRGAAAHGARAGGRRADREPTVGRARHPLRQHLHPRRRPAYRDPDAGGPVRPARGRPPPALPHDRLLGAGERGRRPVARRPRPRIDGCQIGSYPFFKEGRVGANFVIRSTDEGMLEACASDLLRRLQEAGMPVAGGEI